MKVEKCVEEINKLNASLTECNEEDEDHLVMRRIITYSDLWNKLSLKENLLIHKSRLKWLRDKDCNSQYFYGVVKMSNRRKFIGFFMGEL